MSHRPSFNVYAESDFVLDVLKPWPELTPRQVENTYAGIANSISTDGSTHSFTPILRFISVMPLRDLLASIAATPTTAPGGVLGECKRVVDAAIAAQMAASNAALPALAAHFQGKTAPVIAPDATFLAGILTDADAFYGR